MTRAGARTGTSARPTVCTTGVHLFISYAHDDTAHYKLRVEHGERDGAALDEAGIEELVRYVRSRTRPAVCEARRRSCSRRRPSSG